MENINELIELRNQIEKLNKQIKSLKEENRELKEIAYRDPLTNLYNRRGVDKKILNNTDTSYVIAICDVDNFKKVNDKFGHNKGDEVLKFISNTLVKNKRNDDFAVRLGGDEFIVFFKNCPFDIAYEKMKKIKETIYIEGINSKTNISLSIGLNIFNPNDNLYEIIKETDDALYESKKDGKNKITIVNKERLIK